LRATPDQGRGRPAHQAIFELQLALGSAGLATAAAVLAAATASVHRDPQAAHQAVVLGVHITYPEVNLAALLLLALAALGVCVLVRVVGTVAGHVRAYRRFLADADMVGNPAGYPDVTLVRDAIPQAFCAGLMRPRVFVSTAAVDLLTPAELAAVVRHERAHRATRDPLRFALLRALGRSLFFMPALPPLAREYGELAEVKADGAAIAASGGDSRALASALLAFVDAAPVGAAGISPDRVDALLGDGRSSRLPAGLIALSLAPLAALVVLVWRASEAAAANATFNLPVISSQPCVVVLALIPVAMWSMARLVFRRP
jgi:hypothetical protein